MEAWYIIIVTLCISFILKSLFNLFFPSNPTGKLVGKLPPQPRTLPIIGSFLWLLKSPMELGPIVHSLCLKYGPVITLKIGFEPTIFVGSHSLAHEALIVKGATFADRPLSSPFPFVLLKNRHGITTDPYGPAWRILRRNITAGIVHPSRQKSFSYVRKEALDILINALKQQFVQGKKAVRLVDHLNHAIHSLAAFLCFGNKIDKNQIKQIEAAQHRLLEIFFRASKLSFWPKLGRILFRRTWKEFLEVHQGLEDAFLPLIEVRKKLKQERQLGKENIEKDNRGNGFAVPYVDTLLDLQLPGEDKELDDGNIVGLCSEFLSAITDTTTAALEWIMASLVKYPHIQAKLHDEIRGVVTSRGKDIKEEDLEKLPYLKAVILEGLRRHPPIHLLQPHATTEDATLGGYVVPKKAAVNFLVAEMGWDPNLWEDPMEFKPERFMSGGDNNGHGAEVMFDITGSKEIKMMPFGAGRRICAGYRLAILHLEYFVANLIWNFEWIAADGEDVDLSQKQEFMVVMKNPLRARISPRFN